MQGNLAQELQQPQGEVVSFPRKKERKAVQNKSEGFAPLPNFICDEGYLAVLDGHALKCLVLLNRHIAGFHKEESALGEALVMKITGIGDKRTVRKYMTELAKFGLIAITKQRGKSSVYELTFEQRIPVEVVTHGVPSTCDALGTYDDTTPVTCHVPTTSDMACHPVKQIYLNKNIKQNEEEAREEFQAQNIALLQFVKYHNDDLKFYSLEDLSKQHKIGSDFLAQAKISFPEFSEQHLKAELNKLCQWSLSASKQTPQKWMTTWLNWIKNSKTNPVAHENKPTSKSRNVNDAWGEVKQYAPAVDDLELGDME
ncbi:hypothetical protein [Acinetobacter pollinis]|uniref:hypothetical protein n=1 Tax=Acinetobacter pollinis TaxID=2605270 RepID=UPI0018C32F44|nr:hypothetical protein [Acinetobacter pollinis]MBF7694047.1 hypothetical protein [Acinetobacter pollinis]MBF7701676.1 hypothetical protein [Acinetobacter pollinis]